MEKYAHFVGAKNVRKKDTGKNKRQFHLFILQITVCTLGLIFSSAICFLSAASIS